MGIETATIVFAALWAVSEALSLIPVVKANGVFQLVAGILRMFTSKTR